MQVCRMAHVAGSPVDHAATQPSRTIRCRLEAATGCRLRAAGCRRCRLRAAGYGAPMRAHRAYRRVPCNSCAPGVRKPQPSGPGGPDLRAGGAGMMGHAPVGALGAHRWGRGQVRGRGGRSGPAVTPRQACSPRRYGSPMAAGGRRFWLASASTTSVVTWGAKATNSGGTTPTTREPADARGGEPGIDRPGRRRGVAGAGRARGRAAADRRRPAARRSWTPGASGARP